MMVNISTEIKKSNKSSTISVPEDIFFLNPFTSVSKDTDSRGHVMKAAIAYVAASKNKHIEIQK